MKIVGVDPGERYNGLVELHNEAPVFGPDFTPESLIAAFETITADLVAIERFQIWPGRMMALSYSSLGVVETIGILKYLCVKRGIPYVMVQSAEAKWVKRLHHTQGKTPHQVSAYKVAEYVRMNLPRIGRRVVGPRAARERFLPVQRPGREDSRTANRHRTPRTDRVRDRAGR